MKIYVLWAVLLVLAIMIALIPEFRGLAECTGEMREVSWRPWC
jgi:hypothetical protein